jgi:hypothetical protein
VVKKLELAKPPSTLPETCDLAIAIQEKRIASCTVEEIKQAIRYTAVIIGLRAENYPTKDDVAILVTYIQKYYPGHTPAEIRLAFELAIDGKIECEVKHYENFSVMYFSGVMNAYRKWAKDEVKQIPEQVEQKLYPESQLDLEIAQNNLTSAFRYLKKIDKLPKNVIQ